MTTVDIPATTRVGRAVPDRDLADLARRVGPVPALTALHGSAGPETLVCGPRGHVLAPADAAPSAGTVRLAGAARARAALVEEDLTTPPIREAGLVALRFEDGPKPAGERAAWDIAVAGSVAWLRYGLSLRLRDACVSHLRGRRAGSTPLLQQQLVKGALADAFVRLLEVETTLLGPHPDGLGELDLAGVSGCLGNTDIGLLGLLGATGYVVGGPGQVAYVSELLADAYLPVPEPLADGADA